MRGKAVARCRRRESVTRESQGRLAATMLRADEAIEEQSLTS